ncbi:MAG: sigma-70 family RNA polymerase sigma factor [Clostridia bacterium]|nr:sigma-70 family RNA polymerase sigma factor [Clostridia bacterium]
MELQNAQRAIMSDEKIIELYFKRDEQAITQTDIKYRNFLLSIAYNIVHDACDCEECLNDTYKDTWNSIPPARPSLLQAFLAAIMRRTAIDLYKTKTRQKRISSEFTVSLSEIEDFISSRDDTFSSVDANELGRVISDFVRSLSQRKMYIFMSRYYIFRPINEISKLLGCSESTVNKEIASIKKQLKEKLKEEGYTV